MKVIDAENLKNVPRNGAAREAILHQANNQRSLAQTFEDLLGDGGPPNETADDMIRAIRTWCALPSALNE